MNCSVYATLARIGLGTVITVHAGTTPNHTGKFLGIENGNVVLASSNTIFFINIEKIAVVHIP
ncbi:hypothetical protein [Paenibacillus whitsoniae]|uniref:DUF2642 domain-containing protein n=1 Tax=Paenibacillus whitsoniae TaxID=2496558 RepID=A0A430JCE4_9BACL|nr:hypothetical protein [Paenibacillus whitsoniae]RTE08732.1 hypothetical protein EJQ19_15810 [Paenibacillus whitsoniae]